MFSDLLFEDSNNRESMLMTVMMIVINLSLPGAGNIPVYSESFNKFH